MTYQTDHSSSSGGSTKPAVWIALTLPPSGNNLSLSTQAHQAMSLSSKVMSWSEDTWLLDLGPCLSYWHHQAFLGLKEQPLKTKATQSLGVDTLPSICAPLEQIIHTIHKQLTTLFGTSWAAAWTDHPWRTVLLATYMKERNLAGLMVINGPWGEAPSPMPQPSSSLLYGDKDPLKTFSTTASKLTRDLSWETWWQCWDDLSHHLHISKLGRYPLLRRQESLMKQATIRLGWKTPGQQSHLTAPSLARRFGRALAEAWRWTYEHPPPASCQTPGKKDSDFWLESSFPWRSYEIATPPSISRHLETPLREWDHLSPWLLTDLDRLCERPDFLPEERVLLMEWQLILEDVGGSLQDHLISIGFRYPHSLHQEKGNHKTTLLQALYAFEQHFKPHLDPMIIPPVITGWTLTLKEKMVHPKQITSLFGEQEVLPLTSPTKSAKATKPSQPLILTQLENKLAIPLQHFIIQDDWVASDSYVDIHSNSKSLPNPLQHQDALLALARQRPLFTYIQPFPCRAGSQCYFLERTMAKWWSRPGFVPQNDFYCMVEKKSQLRFWVVRDTPTGQWLAQGLFG